jgi:hypothetical protein
MGQRLNIEIINDDKVLANAYYHWAGYTTSAISLTETILHSFIDDGRYDLPKAIALLKSTGATFNSEENDLALLNKELIQFTLTDEDTIHRNKGLISFSKKGIEETEYWEEARVTINIESKCIDFDVFAYITKDEYEEESIYSKIKNIDIDINNISFNEFNEFSNLFNGEYSIFKTSSNDYLILIE